MTLQASNRGAEIQIEYPDKGVYVTASRIKETQGGMTAELLIRADLRIGGKEDIRELNHSRVNLLNDGDKMRLQNRLQEIVNSSGSIKGDEEFSWASTIPLVCTAIVAEYRRGTPVIKFDQPRPVSRRSWLVKDHLLTGVPNVLWAEGGSAKSFWALLTCCLVSRGMSLPQHGLFASKGNVLYCDWEEDAELFYTRLMAVNAGLGIEDYTVAPNIMYKKMRGPLSGQVDELAHLIESENINYCVMDSVGPALGGNGVEQQPVAELFDAMGTLGVTSLLIDHARKGGDDLYGSVYKGNLARQVRKSKKVQMHGSNTLEIMFVHDKANDTGLKPTSSFLVHFDSVTETVDNEHFEYARSVRFEPISPANVSEELKGELPILQLTRQYLAEVTPVSLEALVIYISGVKQTEIDERTVMDALVRADDISVVAGSVSIIERKENRQLRI